MSTSGTLGSLLQGVSQQPPAVRAEGTVTEQVNFLSDVVQGLTSRPALHETGTVLGDPETGLSFIHADFEGITYLAGYKPGTVRVWTLDGTEQTVLSPLTGGNDPLNYIDTAMRPYVFDGKLFLANRDVKVQKASTADTSSTITDVGIATCLGGLFSRKYRLKIAYSDGTYAAVFYETPDGTNTGDAEKTSAEYIMTELYSSMVVSGGKKASTTLDRQGATILVADSAQESFALEVSDDEDDTAIRSFTKRVDDIEDLSETAPHGMLVRVTNSDEGVEDDFFMRFTSDVTSTLGDGFGSGGVWEEWYDTSEIADFDLTTMPHILEKTGPTEFTLRQGDWEGRRVGDEETNPFSDFVGQTIRDIGGFQSRLVFVAGAVCAMSRTNKPFNFFKESAVTELATDPISIKSTGEGSNRLDWIVPFDRDLVLLADPGTGQYVIAGNGNITPETAALVKTTSFEMKGGAKPVETGRTVLFPFKSGRYSGIKEFFTNDEVATNGADTVTETADRYITGLVNHMECSTNFNIVAIKTDCPDERSTVWVHKFLWQGTEKLQSAWAKWVFPETVEYFYFTGSEMVVIMSRDGEQAGTADYIYTALDLDLPVNNLTDYHICLDRQVVRTADGSSTITLPYAGASFVQGAGCTTPGWAVSEVSSAPTGSLGEYTYTFPDETVPSGAELICGVRYAREVKPTMPYARGRDGNPLPRTRLVVNGFMVEYEDTGYFKFIMDSKYRADPIEYVVDWFPLDQDIADEDGNGLRSGIISVPWGERSDWSEFTIYSDDLRPTTILEIEWTGQVFKGSRE